MSGEKDPATSADATSGPRAVPSRRSTGSTAAAWLSVNGNGSSPRVPECVVGRSAWAAGVQEGRDAPVGSRTYLVGRRPRGDETVKHGQGPLLAGPELA
ncbi:hypothetical protein GCM10010222_30070 [Streptomyces tanashiensis]|nr:hypothetical protein GCM10010222_30070 [Streptomyces tanashiensis]